MSFHFLDHASKHLARSAALVLIAGFGAGCSGNVARFQDGFYTGAVNQQNVAAVQPSAQPYPSRPVAAGPRVDGSYTGSVNRGALQPVEVAQSNVQGSQLAPLPNPPQLSADQGNVVPRPPAPIPGARPYDIQSAPANRVTSSPSYDPQPGYPSAPTAPRTRSANVVSSPVSAPTRKTYRHKTAEPQKPAVVAKADPAMPMPAHVPVPRREPNHNKAILPQVPQVREKQRAAAETSHAPETKRQAPPAAGSTYTVQSGDSLYAISRRTGVSVDALKKANGMRDGYLRVGQALSIPSGSAVVASASSHTQAPKPAPATVDRSETASTKPEVATDTAKPKAYTPPKTAQSENTVIAKAEDDGASAPSASGIARMRWPVRGRVLVGYGEQAAGGRNDGIDIMVPEGTPVKAAENGVVIYAGNGLKEFGNTVLLRHEDGLVTVYGHVGKISVSRGDKVHRGQVIARSGMSGNAKVPELHFEVRKHAQPVDPVQYLDRAAG